jgi:O-antigen ligase
VSVFQRELDAFANSPLTELRVRSLFRQFVFVAIVLAVWISTRPFNVPPTDGSVPASDPLNQIVFSGLAVCAVFAVFLAHRRALIPLVQPSYFLLVCWMVVAVITSTQLSISLRAFAFCSIVMVLTAALFVLPERFSDFQRMLIGCAAATMALSYLGVIFLPELGVHTDFDPFEPEHAGSWKGHYDHKNIAGAAMGSLAIIGIYAIRTGRVRLGGVLLLGGFVFLFFTKSKTALALLPLAILCGFLAEKLQSLMARLLFILGPVLLLLFLTLGSALLPAMVTLDIFGFGTPGSWGDRLSTAITAFNKSFMRDPTFTGRFDIWRYGLEMLSHRPLTGYGFEGFWQTSTTLQGESRLELAWAVEKIIHGHNSYLDVALTTGLPGLALVGYVFLLKPALDYHRCAAGRENRLLSTMFVMILIYISLGMCLESYYFRRADPVWFTLLLAVLGLRFTAAYRVAPEPAPAARAS